MCAVRDFFLSCNPSAVEFTSSPSRASRPRFAASGGGNGHVRRISDAGADVALTGAPQTRGRPVEIDKLEAPSGQGSPGIFTLTAPSPMAEGGGGVTAGPFLAAD